MQRRIYAIWFSLCAVFLAEGRKLRRAPSNGPTDPDPIIGGLEDIGVSPCSCDCCMVENLPPDQVVNFADGSRLTTVCRPPGRNDATSMCPATCKASNADTILTAAAKTMDYPRFCNYKCKPTTQSPGTMCTRLTAMEVAGTSESTGNGGSDAENMKPVLDMAENWDGKAMAQASAAAAEKKAATEKKAAESEVHVRWDMRKLIAQRLRAETGADMARAAATEERVHTDLYATHMAAQLSQKVEQAVTPISGKGQESQTVVDEEAEMAGEEQVKGRVILQEAKAEAKKVVAEAKKQATIQIKKMSAAAAKQQAEADAYNQAWDKPATWGKTLAVRAAAPYLKEMVTAIQRTSEYEGFAKGLLGQAKGAQSGAIKLSVHVNQMKSAGDLIGAATEENNVKTLIGKAQSLEAEANKFWNIADNTRKTIPEWQNAGRMASARAAWDFAISYTAAPEF